MILTCLLLPALLAPAQPEAKPAPLPTGRYTVLKISGDLDSDHIARTTAAELDRARGVPLVILELDGNRSRPDVITKIGARIKSGQPAVAVWLRDPVDKHVGVGQVMLGAFATMCFIDPDTRIMAEPADDLRWQAPADTSWETVEQEVTGPLWARLSKLGGDQTLPRVLYAPAQDAWAVPVSMDKPWVLSSAAPAGGTRGPQPQQVVWGMGPRIELDSEAATGLRLCDDLAKSPNVILSSAGLSPRSARSNRSIESGLSEAAKRIARVLDDVKVANRRITTMLAMKPGAARPTAEDYRRAGQSALDQVDRALRELDKADTLLSEFPELNRTREKASPRTGPLRTAIDALRKDLDKHRTTARDFASR